MSVEKARAALVTAYLEAVSVPLPGAPVVGYRHVSGFGTFDLYPTETPLVFTPDGTDDGAAFYPWMRMLRNGSNGMWETFYNGSFGGPVAYQQADGAANLATPDLADWGLYASVDPILQPQEIPTQYDNVDFKPPVNAAWNAVHFAPNNPIPVTCGPDGEDEFTGFLQVTCCCPAGRGENLALEQVKLVLEKFQTGSKFQYQGQEVMVTSAGRVPGFTAQEWYKIPVTVYFLARHQRNTPT